MTIVEVFKCKSCQYQQGPFGTHGFDPTTKNGQLIAKCDACKTLSVGRVVAGAFQDPCHRCRGPVRGHDGSCPQCGSRDCGFQMAF